MKRSSILLTSVIVLLTMTQAFSITRPPAPAAVSAVDYDYANDNIKVTITPPAAPPPASDWDKVKYHVVLLTDLSFPLQRALREGKGTIGPVLSVEKTPADINAGPISINLGNAAYSGRYFTAASLSAIDKNQINPTRVYSSWVLYRNPTSGVPLQVSITKPSKEETPYYRSLSISPTEAMCLLQFSLDNASGNSLTLKNRTTDILTIPDLGSVTGTAALLFEDSLKHAVNSLGTGSVYNAILLQNNKLFSLFFRYAKGASDSMGFRILTSATNKVKYEGMFFMVDDAGYMDMIKTMVALQKVPVNVVANPVLYDGVTPSVPATIPESVSSLFCAAILHLSLAHNSPDADNNEASQSLHNNYIQAVDRFVRGWGGTYGLGKQLSWPNRIKAMHDTILAMDKDSIVDPVLARNQGTIREFDQPIEKRKNYAFYEGYVRLGCEITKPSDYTRTSPVGAGIVFRISNNISLYAANFLDTFHLFDSTIASAAKGQRRIILPANDSLIDKLNTEGLWAKGIDATKGEQPYYTGVSAVRLPLQSVLPHIAIDSGFAFLTEIKGAEDPQGTLIGGPGNSVLKLHEINGNDTLKNTKDPTVLLHGNKRIVEYDANYFEGDSLRFLMVYDSLDRNAMKLTQNGLSALLEDNARTTGTNNRIVSIEKKSRQGGLPRIVTVVLEKLGIKSKSILLKDAKEGELKIASAGTEEIPIAIQRDPDFLHNISKGIVFRYSEGISLLFTRGIGSAQTILPRYITGTNVMEKEVFFDKTQIENLFLTKDSIYAVMKNGFYKGEIEIINKSNDKTEKIVFKPIEYSVSFDLTNNLDPATRFTLALVNESNAQYFYRVIGSAPVRLSLKIPGDFAYNKIIWRCSNVTDTLFQDLGGWKGTSKGQTYETSTRGVVSTWWICAPQTGYNDILSTDIINGRDTTRIKLRFKTRELKLTTPPMSGDDVKMLSLILNKFGFSSPTNAGRVGVLGTTIITDIWNGPDNSSGLGRIIELARHAVEIDKIGRVTQTTKLDNAFLGYLAPKLKDYQNGLVENTAHMEVEAVGAPTPGYDIWVERGARDDSYVATLTDGIAQSLYAGVTGQHFRELILKHWTQQESQIHWGQLNRPFRITVGAFDIAGSIGFSQVQEKYKYGRVNMAASFNIAGNPVNLYEPQGNVRSFAVHSCNLDAGGGFYKAFRTTNYQATKNFAATNAWPRVGSSFTDGNIELLFKGVFAYNQGRNVSQINDDTLPLPQLLRLFPNLESTKTAVRNGVNYAKSMLCVTRVNGSTLYNMSTWSYSWTDTCSVAVGGQITFSYGLGQWSAGQTFAQVRAAARAVCVP